MIYFIREIKNGIKKNIVMIIWLINYMLFLKNDNKWDYVNSNEISTIQTQLKIIGYPCKVDGAFWECY